MTSHQARLNPTLFRHAPVTVLCHMAGAGDDGAWRELSTVTYEHFIAVARPLVHRYERLGLLTGDVLHEIWLRGLRTKQGVTLAECIKTGMDNKGHPMIKTVGMTAGDEECYELFKDLFDPVIDIRHGGYPGCGLSESSYLIFLFVNVKLVKL